MHTPFLPAFRSRLAALGWRAALPPNPSLVAADVRRRKTLQLRGIRLLTSAATVRGFKARIWIRRNLSSTLLLQMEDRELVRVSNCAQLRLQLYE